MGWFMKRPLIEVRGTIDRIGISFIDGVSLHYRFWIEGDGRSFLVDGKPRGPVELQIAMAKPGDLVRFSVREGKTYVQEGLRNLTMTPD